MLVSGIDWHPVTNKIVTCSHDRNAFVWTYNPTTDVWNATVVIAGLDRAALCVRWSPDGRKFAIASSNKNIVLCWFDVAGNWYINSVCKKEKSKSTAKSSIVSLAWHPNNQILTCASTDYRARVIFAYLEATDSSGPDARPFSNDGANLETGEVLAEWEMTKSWINDAQWSPSGSRLAFIGHDGLFHVVTFPHANNSTTTTTSPTIETLKTTGLPGNVLLWLTEKTIAIAGHTMNVDLFNADGNGKWKFVGSADVKVCL